MAIITLNNRATNRSDTASAGQVFTATSATAADFQDASGGKVLQVVTATDSSQRTTTSTSFVTASNTLSVNITPSSSSSKIFIIYSTAIYMDSNNNRIYTTLYRDSTNLGDSSRGLNSLYIGDNDLCVPCSHSILDSPSTTSQVTYQVYIKVSGSTGYFNTDGAGGAGGSITVFEIGA